MNKFNTEWLKETLKNKNIDVTVLEEYIDDKTPILFRCNKCQHEWKVDPSHLKGGRTCPNCRKLERIEINKLNFIEKAREIHGNKYDYSKVIYTKQQNKVIITCPIHGDFELTPNSHLKGRGCPLCAGNNFLRDTEYFIKLAKEVHGDEYDYSKVNYVRCEVPVTIICKKCNCEFELTPKEHLRKHGCPKCKLKSLTKLYEKLKQIFNNEEILFEVGNRVVPWLKGQRFDIYFPKYNIAVEYNGRLHYVPVEHFGGKLGYEITVERDELKRQKCKENNCTLFELKYDYNDEDYKDLVQNIKQIIENYYG